MSRAHVRRFMVAMLGGLLLTWIAPRSSSGQAPVGHSLDRVYLWHHAIKTPESGQWRSRAITDTLHLAFVSDGQVRFSFQLTADNGHSCAMEGIARSVGDYYESRHEMSDASELCTLRLHLQGQEIRIEDDGNRCRRWYCGVRGSINGVVFTRAGTETTSMHKLDGIAPEFVYGSALDPVGDLLIWLRTQTDEEGNPLLVRLPVRLTLSPGGGAVMAASLGVRPESQAPRLTIDDSALGISLADRCRSASSGSDSCRLWLEGYWLAKGNDQPQFLVMAFVRDLTGADDDSPTFAEVAAPPGTRFELISWIEQLGDDYEKTEQHDAGRALVDAGMEAIPVLIRALGDDRAYEVHDTVNRMNLPNGPSPPPVMGTMTVGTRCVDLLYEIITPAASPTVGGNFKIYSEQILQVDDWRAFWVANRGLSLQQLHARLKPSVDAYWTQHGTTQKVK